MLKKLKRLIIYILLIIGIIGVVYLTLSKKEEKEYNSSSDFTSIKEVIEYMQCEYISDRINLSGDYSTVVNLVFEHLPYENGTSYEKFYNQIINLVAYVTKYENFKLSDGTNSIYVAVKCDNKTNTVTEIEINGSTTYFEDYENNQNIKNYLKINNLDVNIESTLLTKLINNSWNSDSVNFGTKDSFFNNYDIYFDEGIEVRNVNGKVFNLIFNKRYTSNIINNLNGNSELNSVVEVLGTPAYGSIEDKVIGYKTDKFYIFFNTDNEVSIYRKENLDTNKFSDIVTKFIEEKNSANLISSLKNIWNNYDYSSSYNNGNLDVRELKYTLNGVKIQFNVNNQHGILLYDEFSGSITSDITKEQVVNKEKNVPKYVYIKNESLTYENEKERLEKFIVDEYSDSGSNTFFALNYIEESKMYIISKDKKNANSEINELVSSKVWLDDNRLIYGVKGKGIYVYNAVSMATTTIITGNDNFIINKIENNVLYYDDTSIKINL